MSQYHVPSRVEKDRGHNLLKPKTIMKEYNWYVRIELSTHNGKTAAWEYDSYCTEEQIQEIVENEMQTLENLGWNVETATILNVTLIF